MFSNFSTLLVTQPSIDIRYCVQTPLAVYRWPKLPERFKNEKKGKLICTNM